MCISNSEEVSPFLYIASSLLGEDRKAKCMSFVVCRCLDRFPWYGDSKKRGRHRAPQAVKEGPSDGMDEQVDDRAQVLRRHVLVDVGNIVDRYKLDGRWHVQGLNSVPESAVEQGARDRNRYASARSCQPPRVNTET